jgi:aspartate aminotransferase
MAARAAKLREAGHRIFAFGVGEPDFETPQAIREAAKKAIDRGASHYTAVTGTPALKKAICAATERDRGWTPKPEQVVVSCGVKHALFNLALALFDPGDEVIIPSPYWVSYPEQVRLAGATPVIVPTREEDAWLLTGDSLAAAITPKTRAIILCTPSNPTGSAYPRERVVQLGEALKKSADALLIVDEIYGELVYSGFKHYSPALVLPELRDRIIQGQSTTNPAAVSQEAAIAALSAPRDDFMKMHAAFEQRRNRMVEGLRTLPGVKCRMPDGAFYALADVRGLYGLKVGDKELKSDEDIAYWLLDSAHAAAVAGTPFGAPGYLRFSYACSKETIDEGLASIGRAIESARR